MGFTADTIGRVFMLDIFVNVLKGFVSLFKYPCIIAGVTLLLFYIIVMINIIMLLCKGYRFKKGKHKKLKKRSILRRLIIDAPRQVAKDMIEADPEMFKYQGCIIFTGRQGRGKTIGMVEYARRMQKEYPLAKCMTNIKYKYQDEKLKHWRQLIDYKNEKRGVIVIMDETQNWFSSNQSKNFPPEMLTVITQNRKNRRIILGTAQSFHLLAKAIRSQATEVRDCITLARCITIVRRREPILDAEGNVVEWKNRGMYFFVHDKELRESYDTYEVVDNLAKSGFQDKDYLIDNGNLIVNIDKK